MPVIASQKLFCGAAALGTPFGDGIPMTPLKTCLINNFRFESWVPDHFPQVAIEILEIARINAPRAIMCCIGDSGSRLLRLFHHRINLAVLQKEN